MFRPAIDSKKEEKAKTAEEKAGIYVSTDAGKNWKSIAGDLPDLYVEKIVLKGTDIYALTENQGLFKSIDQGAHWKSVNNGLPPEYIGDVVIANNILYAGTTWNGIDVYQSKDDSETWTKTSTDHFPGNSIQALLVEDNIIYVGTIGPGLYKSIDGGKTWITIITGDDSIENINSLLDINGTLYASGLSYSKRSVLKSTDQGITWTSISNNLNLPYVEGLAASGQTLFVIGSHENSNHISFSGDLYKTSDAGSTWKKIDNFHNAMGLSIAAKDASVFAGVEGALYKSTDAGDHWEESDQNINANWIKSILALPNNRLLVGTDFGSIFQSFDGGLSWLPASPVAQLGTITIIAQSNTGELFALSYANYIYKSVDGGQTWFKLSLPSDYYPWTLFIDGSTIYIGSGLNNQIYRSTDGGNSWQPFFNPLTVTGVMTVANNTFFAPGYSGSGILKTNINGTDPWSDSLVFPNSHKYGVYTYHQKNTQDNIFSTTSIGLYLSKDNGISWINSGLSGKNVYAISMNNTNQFFAWTADGIYMSTDMGSNWSAANDGLNPAVGINTIANSDLFVYLGTQAGLYQARIQP